MPNEHKLYTGQQILNLPPDLNKPLIDNLIWERDTVMLVGKEKAGKSILAQQICFSISCGEPFLSEYNAQKGCCVYIQAEGKLSETKQRIENMLQGINWDSKNFNLIFHPGLALNTTRGLKSLVDLIDEGIKDGMPQPKLIVIDPLYMCLVGNLSDQEQATKMCVNMRQLMAHYDCGLLVVHHAHKSKRTDKGKEIDEGDDVAFGSFVWKAFPDHVLLFNRVKGGYRELSCATQRSARVIESVELALIQKTPLLFEIKGDVAPYIKVVEMNMKPNFPITVHELMNVTNLSYNSVMRAINYLRKEIKIEKLDNTNPVRWRIKTNGKKETT